MLQATMQKIDFQRLAPHLSFQFRHLVFFRPRLPLSRKRLGSVGAQFPFPTMEHVRVDFTRPRYFRQ
jgi:hypothetical protein